MRLRSSLGELVRGRCRSTNLCTYCARLAAVENAEVLALDAMESAPPAIWAVLTTRTADPAPATFYRAREAVQKALRRRWPDCQYAALVEFTTGYGPRSGGVRRPHWNLLLKGIPVEDADQAREVIASVWCARTDSKPDAQFVGEVAEVGGLMRYLALHFQKESQAPPHGWRGHRFMCSRGYLHAPTPELRERARAQLRYRREVWKLENAGTPDEFIDQLAELAMQVARETSWQLVRVHPLAAPSGADVARRPRWTSATRGRSPRTRSTG